MLIGTLRPLPPYNFQKSIEVAHLHSVLDGVCAGEYWRALRSGSEIALVRVTSTGTVDEPVLHVYLMNATGAVDADSLLNKVSRILGVDADMVQFYLAARADSVLWGIVEPFYGLKHVRAETAFEALATTLIEQQIALLLAQRGERWLIHTLGESIQHDGQAFHTFPNPARITGMTITDLAPLKITTRRMNVLVNMAQQAVNGLLDVNTPQALYNALIAQHGIGQWTAAWAVIRAFGHYEYVGEADVALQAAVNHFFYQESGRATPQRVRETLTPYRAFAGAVAFFTLIHWGTLKYP